MTKALIWAHVYYALEIYFIEDSLEDAVKFSWYMEENESGSFDCIELWDENGYRLINEAERDKLYYEIKAREPAPEPPKPTIAKLWVQPPDPRDKPVMEDSFTNHFSATRAYDELEPFLKDRVWLEIVK